MWNTADYPGEFLVTGFPGEPEYSRKTIQCDSHDSKRSHREGWEVTFSFACLTISNESQEMQNLKNDPNNTELLNKLREGASKALEEEVRSDQNFYGFYHSKHGGHILARYTNQSI